MGGAIDNDGFLSVSRSHFKDSATAAGGTIYCGKCELEVVESRFGRNKETNVPAAIASTEARAAVRLLLLELDRFSTVRLCKLLSS